jgi:hypothetical protein
MERTSTADQRRELSAVPARPIREQLDSITEIGVAMSNKRSAVKPSECENVTKKSRISVTLEKQVGKGGGGNS